MSLRIPLSTKLAVLKSARGIEPFPIRNLARPVLLTIQHKFERHWRSFRGSGPG
jgi:hypothetical protein